ncbi:MAG: hypothetical protein IPK97_18930 [Ahniella sp.]|nr:hypothetical protein [Ahniella sp.]
MTTATLGRMYWFCGRFLGSKISQMVRQAAIILFALAMLLMATFMLCARTKEGDFGACLFDAADEELWST